MKVLPQRTSSSVAPLQAPRLAPALAPAPYGPSGLGRDGARATTSGLSETGTLVSTLRRDAAAHGIAGDIRPGVVEDMRREIAEGRLGSPADLDRAVDALLEAL